MANAFLQIEEPNDPDKKIQSRTATVDGEEVHAEVIQLRGDGGEDFIDGDAANGLDVDVTRSALPLGAGTAANQALVLGELQAQNSLIQDAYDYIALTYTGSNLTKVEFKTGGVGGSVVSTLDLAYTGAQLDSVAQS